MYHLGIVILSQGDILGATIVQVLPSCAQLVSASLWISLDQPVWFVGCFVFPGLELVPPVSLRCCWIAAVDLFSIVRDWTISDHYIVAATGLAYAGYHATISIKTRKPREITAAQEQSSCLASSARIPGQRQAVWNAGREASASENH